MSTGGWRNRFGRLFLLISFLTTGISIGVSAQEHRGETILEEIVVTAQKREQNIQNIGASIVAFTGEQYRELGFGNASDITTQVPNLSFGLPTGNDTILALAMRGVGLNDFADFNESPVAMYIDEVYQGTLAAQFARVFDIERVEVLRGPQGTLYGRNTTGGVVHFVTRKPTDELDAYGEFTYGSFDQIKFDGAIGGPITEKVRGRLSVLHDENDGTQRDRSTGDKGNERDITAVRGQLAVDVTDEIELNLIAHGTFVDNIASFFKHRGTFTASPFVGGVPCGDAALEARQCVDVFGYRDPVSDPDSVATGGSGAMPADIDIYGVSGKLTWRRGIWEIVSISAYQEVDKHHIETAFSGIGPITPLLAAFPLDTKQFTQELRLSRTTENLAAMVGFFYYTDEKDGGVVVVPPSVLSAGTVSKQEVDAYAFFAHVAWNFAPSWSVEGGVRYSVENKEGQADVDTGTVFFPNPSFQFEDEFDTDNVTWDIGLNWHATDNTLLFANISRGFKSGGWNTGGFISVPVQLEPFDDEIITMFEGGIKTTQFGGRLRLNATGFYYDYDDRQVFAEVPFLGIPLGVLSNVGSAEISGFEFELNTQPLDFFEASFGIGYLDTKAKDFVAFSGAFDAQGNPMFADLSGSDLTNAPNWTANGIFRVFHPLFGGEGSVQVDFTYSDEFFFDADNQFVDLGGEFTIWNFRAAWKSPGERYEIALWAKNFTDERYLVEGFVLAEGQSTIWNLPRSVGVSVGVRY